MLCWGKACFIILALFMMQPALADQSNEGQAPSDVSSLAKETNGTRNAKADNESVGRSLEASQLIRQARAMQKNEKHEEARALYEQAVKLDPNQSSAMVHNNLGNVLETLDRWDEAIAEFQKSLSFNPQLELAQRNLFGLSGRKALKDGHLDEAVGFFQKAIKVNPNNAMVHNNLGSALQAQGKLDDAIAEYAKALQIDPQLELATMNIARVYKQKGQYDQSRTYLNKLLQDHPQSKYTMEAKEKLASLANPPPSSTFSNPPHAPFAVADEAYWERTRRTNAVIEKANAMDANHSDQVIAMYREAVKLEPNNNAAMIHNNLAVALAFVGKSDEAIEEYKKALKIDPNLKLAKRNLAGERARSLPTRENFEEAKAFYEETIKAEPRNAVPHRDLANLYMEVGDLDSAILEFEKSLDLDGKSDQAMYYLAECFEDEGEFEKAIPAYQKLIRVMPSSDYCQRAKANLMLCINMLKRQTPEFKQEKNSQDFFKCTTSEGARRWPIELLPVKVCITSGAEVNGFRLAFRRAMIASFDEWTKSTDNRVTWVLVARPEDASIVVNFYPDNTRFKNRDKEPGEQGEVPEYITNGGSGGYESITRTAISIATTDSQEHKPLSDGEIKNISLHEVGHALGLVGHSPNWHDIMFFVTNPGGGKGERTLSARDVATIRRMYADYPVKAPVAP